MLFKRFLQCAFSVALLLCCYCGAEDVPQMLQNLRGRLLSKHWETTHDSYLVTLSQEGNKPLGKNCTAGLVSRVCKDESTFLCARSCCFLLSVEATAQGDLVAAVSRQLPSLGELLL